MGIFKSILKSNFFIRIRSWEYWPFFVVQFPLMIYWLWLSLKARSLFFFSSSNPGILLGGMLGESKYSALKSLPEHLKPRTIFVAGSTTFSQATKLLQENNLNFPLVFKPDIGERGFLVKRIYSLQDAASYIEKVNVNFLIQELVELPIECGVFYVRYPGDENGRVTSIVLKEMLFITGNGNSTVEELIIENDRAKLQWETLNVTHAKILNQVLSNGEKLELNSIGNHCLGTKFLDACHLINDELSASFDRICKQLDGFYFGRIDLKCASLDDLRKGNIKILEVNGCGAEPAHIYQPGFPLLHAYKVLFKHWNTMYTISTENKKQGYSYPSFMEGYKVFTHFRRAMKNNANKNPQS